MSGILDLPEVRQRLTRTSVEDYLHMTELGLLDKCTVLIRGFLIDKMSKSPLHQSITDHLREMLSLQVPEGYYLRTDGPLALSDSVPEPDVAIVRGRWQDFVERHPTTAELVIEVAVTSAREDREMCGIYAGAGIAEYWIVLASEQKVEVYRRPENGAYREMLVRTKSDDLISAGTLSLRVNPGDLFA